MRLSPLPPRILLIWLLLILLLCLHLLLLLLLCLSLLLLICSSWPYCPLCLSLLLLLVPMAPRVWLLLLWLWCLLAVARLWQGQVQGQVRWWQRVVVLWLSSLLRQPLLVLGLV
jgi:hypothetical protein